MVLGAIYKMYKYWVQFLYDLPIVILGTMVYNKDILRRKEVNPMEWIQIIKDLAETVVLVYAAWKLIRKLVKKIRKKNKKKKRK